jgi:hypothetical protein
MQRVIRTAGTPNWLNYGFAAVLIPILAVLISSFYW